MSTIGRILHEIHDRFRQDPNGAVADYIPELTRANPHWFGISVVTTDGHRYSAGDCAQEFTIQSISKAFTYGLALDERGPEAVLAKIGVEPSGEAFNEISLEQNTGRPYNPMINAGAIAATSLVPSLDNENGFERIRRCLSDYAARDLAVDEAVYQSESRTGFRNRAIAYLLCNSGILQDEVEEVVDAYFRQCSILVSCNDLALMGATLACGGINPVTGKRAILPENVERVLSVMATCGMYDSSGEWNFRVGLPAKSGVGGGILGVLPGQMGLAVFSPKLDQKGNSVRGVRAFAELSRRFNLNLFNLPTLSDQSVRSAYDLSAVTSKRQRPKSERDILRKYGDRVLVIEMQGDLFFSSIERALRVMQFQHPEARMAILDLTRVGLIDACCAGLLKDAAEDLAEDHRHIVIIDPKRRLRSSPGLESIDMLTELQPALERAERELLASILGKTETKIDALVPFHEFEVFAGLAGRELSQIESLLQMQSYRQDECIVSQGSQPDYLYLLAKGSAGVFVHQEGSSHRIHGLSPGVTFGDIAIVERSTRSADIVAEDDTVCYQLSAEQFYDLEDSSPAIHARIISNLLKANLAIIRDLGRELAVLRSGQQELETPSAGAIP